MIPCHTREQCFFRNHSFCNPAPSHTVGCPPIYPSWFQPPPPKLLTDFCTIVHQCTPCVVAFVSCAQYKHCSIALRGRFAQRAHSSNYYVIYPRNTPESHPPTEACMIHSKQHQGCRIQDPGTRGKHQTKNPWCTSRGCRVQSSGPWDPWLPVVKNSRLFAQRGHSARCAPSVPCDKLQNFSKEMKPNNLHFQCSSSASCTEQATVCE